MWMSTKYPLMVQARVDEALAHAIDKAAETAGKTVSAYLRCLAQNAMGIHAESPPGPPPEAGVFEEQRKYPQKLQIRVNSDQAWTIKANASLAGKSVSRYLREIAMGHRVQATTDVRMLSELRRIGRMVANMWKQGREDEAEDIRAGLAEIKAAIQMTQEAQK